MRIGDKVKVWASTEDWSLIDVVIVCLYDQSIIEALRAHTDVAIVCFDPRPNTTREPGDGVKLFDSVAGFRPVAKELLQNKQRTCTLINTDANEPALVEQFDGVMHQAATRAASEERTHKERAAAWTDNMLAAVPSLAGRACLTDIGKPLVGIPTVIVGAGPSLSLNVEQLKRLKDKVAIVAVNSSMAPLLAAGVTPDLCMALDLKPAVGQMLEGCDVSKTILVAGAHVDPAVYDLDWLEIVPMIHTAGVPSGWLSKALERPEIPTGASCTHAAFVAAMTLGATQMILAGQDCAYADNLHYCDNAHSKDRIKELGGGLVEFQGVRYETFEVKAWGGKGFVRTDRCLDGYRQWFEDTAQALDGKVRIINATEGGARIGGTEELALASIADGAAQWEPIDIASRVLLCVRLAPKIEREALQLALELEHHATAELLDKVRSTLRLARRMQEISTELKELQAAAPIASAYAFKAVTEAKEKLAYTNATDVIVAMLQALQDRTMSDAIPAIDRALNVLGEERDSA